MKAGRFAAGLIVLVLGALMLADGVVTYVTGTPILFSDVDSGFKAVVGFIAIVLAASVLDESRI